jgi:Flp pilus assembly pilin Flp
MGDMKNKGQTMTEYVLILAAIAAVVLGAYRTVGTTLKTELSTIDSKL